MVVLRQQLRDAIPVHETERSRQRMHGFLIEAGLIEGIDDQMNRSLLAPSLQERPIRGDELLLLQLQALRCAVDLENEDRGDGRMALVPSVEPMKTRFAPEELTGQVENIGEKQGLARRGPALDSWLSRAL